MCVIKKEIMDINKNIQPQKIFDQYQRKQNQEKLNHVKKEFDSIEIPEEDLHIKSNSLISKTVHAIPADEQQLENYDRVAQI